jgi:glycosyltransferase involved in cell wall biosynthesis
MYKGFKISVVMPAYNEAAGIEQTVSAYRSLPEVDQVIVADNNSSDDTKALAQRAGAVVVPEAKQGYGYACQKALTSATGDFTFLVESDGTFRASDLYKFLAYAPEFDAVFGTRTSKSCIWKGSNMGLFLRYGNCAVAKLLEYLHNGPCLTDVGCTCKIFRRDALHAIAPRFTAGASHFSPQLMILAIRSGLRCVEIPVHYQPRLGQSRITGSFRKAFFLGCKMIGMIILYRFKSIQPVTFGSHDKAQAPNAS